ncbi:hypothetical protein EVJ58_g1871 [Rhodofomes roseus]|uniref:RNA-dependent RNA polymerase n=1 Tax=Rhodofomes roseus TaxID=34475 RepID=A0A4Y9YWW4_9APHY|nr:hypothetical protein EVJ58_g1871 [Rhodofomes roseus]
MVNIPNVVVLVARVTKNGSVTKPEEQPLRSFRAARLVGDPRRFLFLSTLKEGFDSDKQGIQALLKDWIANGIQVGGIRYTWLGYSDVHVKAGKVIFFREDANWTVRRLLQEIGDVHQVFLDHGHGKYAARLGLSFSSTVDAKDVYGRTVLLDDLRARDGSLHTDGCGMIRASYARELCNTLHIPEDTSVFQIRCGGVKGLLSAYPDPDFERLCNTENRILNRDIVGSEVVIAFRRSMLKYDGGPTMLEINDHCSRPGSARLNEFIILHLLTLGVAWDVFRKLLLDQLDFIGAIANDRNKALRAVKGELDASSTVFGQDLYSLLLACQDLKEPYVQWKLSLFQQKQYDNLREKLSIAVEDSAYLFGVVDEYGILEADEVFINIPGRIGVLAKPSIMVCRNPSYDPGDVRTFRAVYREELKHLTNCIVFSRKSRHSVPDTMASGDLDGDMYLTVWDTNLVPQSVRDYVDRPASASAASGTARSRNDHVDMAQAAMSTFIDHRFNGLLGIMATEWKLAAICSPHLTDEPHARKLGLLTESALDAIKSGTDMQELKRRFFAVRTQARNAAARYRDFRNPLNCLRDLVPRKDGAKISSFTCDDALLIQDQDPKVWDDVMREARQAMREFNRELSQALRVDGEWKDGMSLLPIAFRTNEDVSTVYRTIWGH